MKRSFAASFLLFFAALGLAACSSTRPPPDNGGMFRERNEGYSILYKLMKDESDVSKVFLLKHADESVGSVVKDIAKFSQDEKKRMDEFPKSDSHIEYDVADLPKVEQKSRDVESDWAAKQMLFSSGTDFERQLLLTQAQAMAYAKNLAEALADVEDNPDRKSFLHDLSHRSGDFYDRVRALLVVKVQ